MKKKILPPAPAAGKPDTIAIRPARAEDEAPLRELAQRAYEPWVAVIGRRPAPMDDDYARHIAAGEVFVLEMGAPEAGSSGPAAFCVLVDGGDHLLIDSIAVAPGRQGAGLGRALIGFAEATARARGLPELRLFTHERMASNIALYARLGFVETHCAVQAGFARVFMARRLP